MLLLEFLSTAVSKKIAHLFRSTLYLKVYFWTHVSGGEKKANLFSQLEWLRYDMLGKATYQCHASFWKDKEKEGMDQKKERTKQKQFFHVSTVIPSKFMSWVPSKFKVRIIYVKIQSSN